ncbi:MAG: hypothetical protein LQ350_008388 [Teloschistes chrysophthalmus]|nr:MAG: hypothetical protein LQ350_008388 [Niorma chrysophthalma]
MPIKWSAEQDQELLRRIIETSQINVNAVDTEVVASAWSKSYYLRYSLAFSPLLTFAAELGDEKPTPIAIKRRLERTRAMSTNAPGGGSEVKMSNDSKDTTPKKTAASKAGIPKRTPAKKGQAAGDKRKRGPNSNGNESPSSSPNNAPNASDSEEAPKAPKKAKAWSVPEGQDKASGVKTEEMD